MLLPAKEAMLEDSEQEKISKLDRGIPLRHFHKMGTTQWDYNRSLCKLANLNPLRMAVETLYNDVHERRRHHLTSYKKDIYELLTNSDEYKRVVWDLNRTSIFSIILLRHFHKMGTTQWDYNRSLCKLANFNPLRMAVETLYNDVRERYRHPLSRYKKFNLLDVN